MKPKGLLLFDIDGVIRDVEASYRLAIQETVNHFCSWQPSLADIDELKQEGIWNNDWDASRELIKRFQLKNNFTGKIPTRNQIEKIFSDLYFGIDRGVNNHNWDGFIKNEKLLVDAAFFKELKFKQIKWGFVSGAEKASARYLLESRLKIDNPPLITMEDAPDKPNPQGLLQLAKEILGTSLGPQSPPIGYLGDTVSDILTIKNSRLEVPSQTFYSLAIAPPHLHKTNKKLERLKYENSLLNAGADYILSSISQCIDHAENWP